MTSEKAAYRTACDWRAPLYLCGEDRKRFLGGLVTCDVRGLAEGQGTYGYFTSLQGRILADVAVLSVAGRLRLDLPRPARAAIEEHLGKYLLADRVELATAEESHLRLVGAGLEERLAEVFEDLPREDWRGHPMEEGGWLVRRGRRLRPCFDLFGADASLLARLEEAGIVSLESLDPLRVRAGEGRWGVDYGPENLPQEVGEEQTVNYEKGCYLGQEVVARIHYRGGVQKRLRGLRIPGAKDDPSGRPVLAAGREAGKLTTAVPLPDGQGWLALGIVHDRAEGEGVNLELEGGLAVELVSLPYGPDDRA